MPGDREAIGGAREAPRRGAADRPQRPVADAAAYLAKADMPLLELLQELADQGYQFTTPGPLSHRRIRLRRSRRDAEAAEDVFGWNLPFRRSALGPRLVELMAAGGILRPHGERFVSALGVASVGEQLFLHSSMPREAKGHVFFGPDSYRFVDFLRAELPPLGPGARIADVGTGAGVGGIFTASRAPGSRLVLADVNPEALRLARINAAFAGLAPQLRQCDGVPAEDGPFEVVTANPPYVAGTGLTYSDGGGAMGAELSVSWAEAAMARLSPGGRLLLYSGSAIVRGQDGLKRALADIAERAGCSFRYRELDADVFPATLLHPRYWRAERIAAVGAVMVKRP
jgi:methylase of polypeptide subunit release factors